MIQPLTPYELFQLDRYGSILQPRSGNTPEELENGTEEAERFKEWIEQEAENQFFEEEY